MSSKLEIQEYLSQVVVNLVELDHREWLRTNKYKNEF